MSHPTLVTGATGFVGSAVARNLLARGHNLRLMVRAGSDRRNIDGLQAELVEGDLSNPASFVRAVDGCRYVFHVAADYRLWVPDPAPMMAANVEGTRLLMLAALRAGVERIVYCSSVAALGLIGDGTSADETTPVHEHGVVGLYKKSKYRAEQEVLRLTRDRGLPAVIVNPSTPVGPRDVKPTPTGQMILDCAAGRMPAYVDTGVNIVHVDDVAEGHALALERGVVGEKYILGGENYLLGDLFRMVSEIAGVKPPRISLRQEVIWPVAVVSEWLSRRFGVEPRVTREMLAMSRKKMFFSSDKAIRDLGYAPRPAREAVADAVAWFREAGMLG
ncbi:NAD-dependent epimerase/dehydratase family protein [Acetobacter sacchari]|uniref:NAD-dependent epimerase/dehydratase family protein n=1 Tax=Acetobacter sacchari TaxID=2661687 RepID=A0ABS3LTT2_9PROT|nr:hopanoid-associated sugar epimerase [Acetobacter sacchari]MBO1359311.1 NAD-dependent epimerase/dehydratase family protein [Acetobacter sacchari]